MDPISYEPTLLTIGDVKPVGICGSGIIDAVAELLKAGVLSQNGKFDMSLPTARLRETDGANEYVVGEALVSFTAEDIVIIGADFMRPARAKADIFAGIM